MTDSRQTIRIFISSPSDVSEERDGARRVIESLQRLYPNATLTPVLWEDLALPATASFQETIDHLLEREPIDIAVFILWSRLGSPLGPSITRPDGTPYRSGTEREFELMLVAHERSGCRQPTILAYVREDDPALIEAFGRSDASEWEELVQQRSLAKAFIREQFHDAEGRNLRAYQTYREPIGFTQRLRVHVRRAIDELLEVDSVTWTEEPYRGLQIFDIEHAPIFHGRDEETCELLQRLRDQQRAGCAFVAIVAASGAGKSSLARAGVAAKLVEEREDGVDWKVSSFIPALADRSLFIALVHALSEALPELIDSDQAAIDVAEGLTENPALTVKLTIAPAFARAAPSARALLILDQMEELWTDRQTTDKDREGLLKAIDALARSGRVAVLASLRSDFYHHAQTSPTFLQLKGRDGQFDLLSPNAGSIHRLIVEPARLSGLHFEKNEKTGRSLDEVILEDVSHDPNALPLLEYTLSELYRQRDENRRMMTFAAYVELGGVEGAIGKRAEEMFASLSPDAQSSFDEILPLLVSVDVIGERSAVRRRANMVELTATPARKNLTERLIAERFLTTDCEGETPVASLAHEALLRSWARIATWIDTNGEHLRRRARVEQLQQQWEKHDNDGSLLLGDGVPLNEGQLLLHQASYLLTDSTKHYIEASIAHQDRLSRQHTRQRIAVFSSIACVCSVIAIGGIYLRRSTEASALVETLTQANTSAIPNILDSLSSYPILAENELIVAFNESPQHSDAKLHAGLALLERNESALPYLKEHLLDVSAAQFSVVRELLDGQKGQLIEYYRGIANNRNEDDRRRFQAACALASYEPMGASWSNPEFTSWVANQLVGVLPSELLPLRNALSEVRESLIEPLTAIYADVDRDTQQRGFATDTLADYLRDDPVGLFNLLTDANEKQFSPMFNRLVKHHQRAIELGHALLTKSLPADASEADKETLAIRQANAAVMLLRMDASDHVWPLLKHSPDPRVRSYIIHWLARRGGKADPIVARYEQETDVAIKRALLLCLGEFEIEREVKDSLIDKLLPVYESDPDAGLHAAAQWLLRKWKQSDNLAAIDQQLQQNEEQLVADQDRQRQWYVNTEGQTFVILDGSTFMMGSPNTETGHDDSEKLHLCRIERRFAISSKEVTEDQFRRFSEEVNLHESSKQLPYSTQNVPEAACPKASVSWYESAWYCNWLSAQEGIPEDQWCYLPNDQNQYGQGMRAKDNFHELSGYRLPTEAEWEFACRAGAVTSRHYGESDELLGNYAWYIRNEGNRRRPVGLLKPNDFGLFDMCGNVWNWCYDELTDYPVPTDRPTSRSVRDDVSRILRGGSYSLQAKFVRSACRGRSRPTDHYSNDGFRPARTYPSR